MAKRSNSAADVLRLFRIMADGRWHSNVELGRKCCNRYGARLYDLKKKEWGAWEIQRERGSRITSQRIPMALRGEYHYRIPPHQLLRRKGVKAILLEGHKPSHPDEDPGDDTVRMVRLKLSVADVTFLLALVNNMPDLKIPEIKVHWDQRWPVVATKLREALPDDIKRPRDLNLPTE